MSKRKVTMSDGVDFDEALNDEGDLESWKTTYLDLITLLLCFFILLASMSSMDLKKFKDAVSSIQVSMGDGAPAVQLLSLVEQDETLSGEMTLGEVIGLEKKDLTKAVEALFKEKWGWEDELNVDTKGDKVILRMGSQVVFPAGSAELNPKIFIFLNEMVDILKNYPALSMHIRGHTDDSPISTPQFPSNWELSSVRAVNVFKYFVNEGIDPMRMTATGYGTTFPIDSNATEEGRKKNRRVEFVLEAKKS